MLRFGPDAGPVAVVAQPLFEEANRTRGFAVTICRALAKRGVASVLPDLPGQGESVVQTRDTTLHHLRQAFAATFDHLFAQGQRAYAASIRSGAMIGRDAQALGRWHLSPADSNELLQEFVRVLNAGGRGDASRDLRNVFQANETSFPIEIAGNLIGARLLEELTTDHSPFPLKSVGVPLRTIRIDSDPRPADRHVPGTPLWRRAEPDNDPALAALLADDIADWITACEG